jgi:hypothetical protein
MKARQARSSRGLSQFGSISLHATRLVDSSTNTA